MSRLDGYYTTLLLLTLKAPARRFLNHSCDPNCLIQLVRWGPRAFPRPAIFVSLNLYLAVDIAPNTSG